MKKQPKKYERFKPEREDRPGEAEKRQRMRAMYGVNTPVMGDYNRETAAVCDNGTYVGTRREGVIAYRGIPFAEPPVGKLRWKPPVRAAKRDGVYQAFYFGHSPIQTEWPSEEGSYYPQSEDCLTLNIWTSEEKTGGRPVMVFFHGGSYGWGATSDPIYDGHNLVAAYPDVVLVTAEYRVGIMGFIDFSEVPGGEEYRESGNLGLLDHICALEWVRDNIAAFGGDPENVTIFGESAGGGTVSLLPIMPQAKGLFRRAIAESGSIALTYSRRDCQRLTERLLRETGLSSMEELTALSEEELMRVNEQLNDYNNFPERDGVVLPEDLYEAYKNGAAADVDMMIGTNQDEVRYWIREMGYYSKNWLGRTTFKLGMPLMFDSDVSNFSQADRKAAEQWLDLCKGRKVWRIVEFYNDILFRVPAAFQAEAQAAAGAGSYVYYWTYPSAHKGLGACHAVELAYVFNNLDVTIYTGDNVDHDLAEAVQDMWVNFARCGDPSTDLYRWEPYSAEKRSVTVLGKKIEQTDAPMEERRTRMEPLLAYGLNGCYTNLKIRIPPLYVITAILAAIIGFVPTVLLVTWGLLKRLFRRSHKRRMAARQKKAAKNAK